MTEQQLRDVLPGVWVIEGRLPDDGLKRLPPNARVEDISLTLQTNGMLLASNVLRYRIDSKIELLCGTGKWKLTEASSYSRRGEFDLNAVFMDARVGFNFEIIQGEKLYLRSLANVNMGTYVYYSKAKTP